VTTPKSLSPTSIGKIDTQYGAFFMDVFTLGGAETIVLHTEDIPGTNDNVVCRIQSECISHAFFDQSCDCSQQVSSSLQRIREVGTGLLIYLRQEGMAMGMAARLADSPADWRSYYAAVAILHSYGVKSVQLISLNKRKMEALEQGGIEVRSHDYSWHEGRTILLGDRIKRAVEQVRRGEALRPIPPKGPRVLILGDLNIDLDTASGTASPGGTAYNAAVAIKQASHFVPIIFGKVGRDMHGEQLRAAIGSSKIYCLLGLHEDNATGFVKVTKTGSPHSPFQFIWEKKNNANDYDAHELKQAVELAGVCDSDLVFVASYLFVQKRFAREEINNILRILKDTKAKLVLDLVRKSLQDDVLSEFEIAGFSKDTLARYLEGIDLYAVIADLGSLSSLRLAKANGPPDRDVFGHLLRFFGAKWIICRYVEGRDSKQAVAGRQGSEVIILPDDSAEMRASSHAIGSGDAGVTRALLTIQVFERANKGA
jgi:GTP cyclohydrolase II